MLLSYEFFSLSFTINVNLMTIYVHIDLPDLPSHYDAVIAVARCYYIIGVKSCVSNQQHLDSKSTSLHTELASQPKK